jgi:hypothetical protein
MGWDCILEPVWIVGYRCARLRMHAGGVDARGIEKFGRFFGDRIGS